MSLLLCFGSLGVMYRDVRKVVVLLRCCVVIVIVRVVVDVVS